MDHKNSIVENPIAAEVTDCYYFEDFLNKINTYQCVENKLVFLNINLPMYDEVNCNFILWHYLCVTGRQMVVSNSLLFPLGTVVEKLYAWHREYNLVK